jgi:hypothetical protein
MVELPESHGYDTIMNIVNSITKRAHFIPTHTTIMAKGATWLYECDHQRIGIRSHSSMTLSISAHYFT